MKIIKNEKYEALIDYNDGYASIKQGDIFIPNRISNGANGSIWIYPEVNHPIPLDVFISCFERVIDSQKGKSADIRNY